MIQAREFVNKLLFRSLIISILGVSVIARLFPVEAQGLIPGQNQVPSVGINLTLSPSFLTLITDPGEAVSSEIQVTNNNNFTENLTVTIDKFEATDDGARPLISEMKPEDIYKNWVKFDHPTFSVGPGQTRSIKFTLTPPKNAGLGYYYAFVIGRTQKQARKDQGASVSGSPAVLTLLDVRSPQEKRAMQIGNFSTDKLFYEYLPASFQVKMTNTGNIFLFPGGDIFIDSMFHKNIAVLPVNPGHGNVLPGTDRVFTVNWQDGFAVRVPKVKDGKIIIDSRGKPEYTTKYDFSKANEFRFGKYTAHLVMAYDDGQRDVPLEATVTFWIIPWKIIGVAALFVIFALVGLSSIFRSMLGGMKK